MSIITFIKRIWSPYDNNSGAMLLRKTSEEEQIISERERDARILELLDNSKPTGKSLEELARLMGQTDEKKI